MAVMQRAGLWITGWLVCTAAATAADTDARWLAPLVVPDGFEVSVFATDAHAHSIHNLTFDAKGRCVVSGPGYVTILEDTDGDGTCDVAKRFGDAPASGLQGMLFVGSTLYGVDDRGVVRMPDDDGDDRADTVEPIGPRLTRGGEHGCHGIVLGPDGWLYVVVGNQARFGKQHITTDTSPVLEPVQGNIIRMTLDGSRCEAVSTGLRNPYDLALRGDGEVFSVDSDNEGELGLPFYREPRLVHAIPGMDIGWRDADGQWPDYHMDTIPPACDMGRGSPAGVVFYHHTQFPAKYRGALLAADWSWSRIVAFFPKRDGATWTATREDLVRTSETVSVATHGERDYAAGFYPSDLDVAPDGSVYIALGGRDTLGVVYRLRYLPRGISSDTAAAYDPIRDALTAPQPEAAWSRARVSELRNQTGVLAWRRRLGEIAADRAAPSSHRRRALTLLLAEPNAALPGELLRSLVGSGSAELDAGVADAIRAHARSDCVDVLLTLMHNRDAFVRRRAIEAWPAGREDPAMIAALVERLGDDDRLCRHAAARALQHFAPSAWRARAAAHASRRVRLWATLVDVWTNHARLGADAYLRLIAASLERGETTNDTLEALRVLEHLLDREFVAAASLRADDDSVIPRLRAEFPTDDWRVNREIINLLVQTDTPGTAELLLGRLESDDALIERLHVVKMAARLDYAWRGAPLRRLVDTWARRIRPRPEGAALSATDLRARSFEENRYWRRICRDDPATAVEALLAAGHHGPLLVEPLQRLDEATFAALWPGDAGLRSRYVRLDVAVRRVVLRRLGAAGASGAAAFVRAQVDDLSVRAEALRALRRFRRRQDFDVFQQAIADDDVAVVRAAGDALAELRVVLTDETVFTLIRQLSRTVGRSNQRSLRDTILGLLETRVERSPVRRRLRSARDEMQMAMDWQEWFEDTHPAYPDAFAPLRDPTRIWVDRRNVAGELLRRVAWAKGDAAAGAQQFARLGCNNCHVHRGQGRPLGPDLTGVGKRLSRRDLMDAIVLPSKSVPPRYQYTLFRLRDGRVIGGVVSGAADGAVQVMTGEGESVDIPTSTILERVPQTESLMPTGALDPASEQDIADLFAFLSQ